MTELFVLLWLADAVGTLSALGAVTCVLLCFGYFLVFILDSDSMDEDKRMPVFFNKTKWLLVAFVVIAVLPSPTTIRALVAVKVGDFAVHSELGEKAIKTLETVLDRVVEGKKD